MEALRVLSSDPRNEVFVISGLQLLPLEEVFGHLDRIGLAAANGLYLSMPEMTAAAHEGDGANAPGYVRKQACRTGRAIRCTAHSPTDRTGPPCTPASPNSSPTPSPQRKGKKRSWSLLDYGVNWAEVKDIALPILERYTARTNGSSVRLRDPGIAWSY